MTPDYPCQNPACRSYGRPHMNCKCSAPGEYAQGGSVCASNLAHHESCEHFADGDLVQSNHEFQNDPGLAIDHAIANSGLSKVISRAGYTKSMEPGRANAEFLHQHRNGRKALHFHMQSLMEPKAAHYKPDESGPKALQTELDRLQTNPESGLDIGGSLDIHAPLLAAKAATAATYLQSIKPQPTQGGSLDPKMPPSHADEKAYQRQLELIEDPKLIFKRVSEGNAVPQDFQTLQAVYPKLRARIADRAFEKLAETSAAGKKLTYKQKRGLGALVGEPVTLQQSPIAIAAIMQANAPMQMPAPPPKQKKASSTELNQINKVNELSETNLQKLETRKR